MRRAVDQQQRPEAQERVQLLDRRAAGQLDLPVCRDEALHVVHVGRARVDVGKEKEDQGCSAHDLCQDARLLPVQRRDREGQPGGKECDHEPVGQAHAPRGCRQAVAQRSRVVCQQRFEAARAAAARAHCLAVEDAADAHRDLRAAFRGKGHGQGESLEAHLLGDLARLGVGDRRVEGVSPILEQPPVRDAVAVGQRDLPLHVLADPGDILPCEAAGEHREQHQAGLAHESEGPGKAQHDLDKADREGRSPERPQPLPVPFFVCHNGPPATGGARSGPTHSCD